MQVCSIKKRHRFPKVNLHRHSIIIELTSNRNFKWKMLVQLIKSLGWYKRTGVRIPFTLGWKGIWFIFS